MQKFIIASLSFALASAASFNDAEYLALPAKDKLD